MVILRFCVLCFVFCLGANIVWAAPADNAAVVQGSTGTAEAGKARVEGDIKPLDYIAIVNGERVSMGVYVSALRRGLKQRGIIGAARRRRR